MERKKLWSNIVLEYVLCFVYNWDLKCVAMRLVSWNGRGEERFNRALSRYQELVDKCFRSIDRVRSEWKGVRHQACNECEEVKIERTSNASQQSWRRWWGSLMFFFDSSTVLEAPSLVAADKPIRLACGDLQALFSLHMTYFSCFGRMAFPSFMSGNDEHCMPEGVRAGRFDVLYYDIDRYLPRYMQVKVMYRSPDDLLPRL